MEKWVRMEEGQTKDKSGFGECKTNNSNKECVA